MQTFCNFNSKKWVMLILMCVGSPTPMLPGVILLVLAGDSFPLKVQESWKQVWSLLPSMYFKFDLSTEWCILGSIGVKTSLARLSQGRISDSMQILNVLPSVVKFFSFASIQWEERLLPTCLTLLDICIWAGASCLMSSVESHRDDCHLSVVK